MTVRIKIKVMNSTGQLLSGMNVSLESTVGSYSCITDAGGTCIFNVESYPLYSLNVTDLYGIYLSYSDTVSGAAPSVKLVYLQVSGGNGNGDNDGNGNDILPSDQKFDMVNFLTSRDMLLTYGMLGSVTALKIAKDPEAQKRVESLLQKIGLTFKDVGIDKLGDLAAYTGVGILGYEVIGDWKGFLTGLLAYKLAKEAPMGDSHFTLDVKFLESGFTFTFPFNSQVIGLMMLSGLGIGYIGKYLAQMMPKPEGVMDWLPYAEEARKEVHEVTPDEGKNIFKAEQCFGAEQVYGTVMREPQTGAVYCQEGYALRRIWGAYVCIKDSVLEFGCEPGICDCDINGDGEVNILDFTLMGQKPEKYPEWFMEACKKHMGKRYDKGVE